MTRVRFAPSPTGFLHLGGLRTALYNFWFSKQRGGTFVLRIENTDVSRTVPGAAEYIEDILKWVGITPDEGPSVGGSYGPYIQSERLKLYQEKAEDLIKVGAAYRCFCTDDRLQSLKKEMELKQQIPKYDNKCRSLLSSEINERLLKNKPYAIRFKLQEGPSTYNDMVFGEITDTTTSKEGDPVLIRRNGYPTYHLASVVDDYTMGITHVLRGVEWQSSTVKHLMLYSAFKWSSPYFSHLPLILNKFGQKLSKRDGHVHVEHFKKQGYFPESILNALKDIGGGFGQKIGETYTKEQLIQNFKLEKVNKGSCYLDLNKIKTYNQRHLQAIIKDRDKLKELVNPLKTLAQETFHLNASELPSKEYVLQVLQWSKDRISTISDLVSPHMKYLWLPPDCQKMEELNAETVSSIEDIISNMKNLSSDNFNRENLGAIMKTHSNQRNIKYSVLMKHLRHYLTGFENGPSVAEILELLGQDISLRRLEVVLQKEDTVKS